jgi:hypothetical protein
LTQGPALRQLVPVYGVSAYYPANPSTSSEAFSGLNPHAELYYLSTMTSLGTPGRENHPPTEIELLIIGSAS